MSTGDRLGACRPSQAPHISAEGRLSRDPATFDKACRALAASSTASGGCFRAHDTFIGRARPDAAAAQAKDRLQNALHDRMSSGRMKLTRAQRIFGHDWRVYESAVPL
jgi:hypothetical protein